MRSYAGCPHLRLTERSFGVVWFAATGAVVASQVGSKTPVTVDPATFYAVAFVCGFSDKSFRRC